MKYQKLTEKYHLPVYNRFPLTLEKAQGAYVWDTEGHKYIDAMAGIAVNSLGHCHPNVVQAIREQSEKLMHISNFYYSEPQAKLLELLTDISGMSHGFLCNSGGEAMEAAVKAARRYGRQQQKEGPLLTVSNAFHGRTMGTISMGMSKYAEGYGPLLNGFQKIAFNDVEELRSNFTDQTLGIVLETVQGSGGLKVASEAFIQEARQLCDKHNALFIIDEVQTGMGRTGKMFGFKHYGIQPDIIAVAKAMGGGFPIGGMLCQPHIADAMEYGAHGSTYGGNPLACAASYAAIKTLVEEELCKQATEKGIFLKQLLEETVAELPEVTDIRGKGLMIGVALDFEGRPVVSNMMKKGILSNCTHGNVIRLVPPLTIGENDLQAIVKGLTEAIQETAPAHTTN